MENRPLFVVQWYEDADCHLKHEKVFGNPTDAHECAAYLKALGTVYNVRVKPERRTRPS